MIRTLFKSILIGCGALMLGIVADITLQTQVIIKDVQAKVARVQPARRTTARRTTRRVIRSTRRYVARLPGGCTTVVIEGTRLHHCGSTYYQAYGSKYVVVVIE